MSPGPTPGQLGIDVPEVGSRWRNKHVRTLVAVINDVRYRRYVWVALEVEDRGERELRLDEFHHYWEACDDGDG